MCDGASFQSPFDSMGAGVPGAAGGFLQGGDMGGAGFGGGGGVPSTFFPDVVGGYTPGGAAFGGGAPATASYDYSLFNAPLGDAVSAATYGGGPSGAGPQTPTVVTPSAPVVPSGATAAAGVDPIGIGATTQTSIPPADLAASAAGAGSTPGFFARLAKDVGQFKKDYQPLLDVAGLGLTGAGVLKQLMQPGGVEALSPLQQEQLNLMRQQQQTAQQYMTGQVTPEMQQNLMNQTKARIAAIKNKYAKLGMSGSTAENQDLAAAQAQATQQLGQMQSQMIQTGAQMMGLPAVAISRLTAQQDAQSAAFNAALAQFIASMAGRPQDRPTP